MELQTFTVIEDADLVKARPKGKRNVKRKSVAIYTYTDLKTGAQRERYFRSQTELDGFLRMVARGGKYANVVRVDIEGHRMPENEQEVSVAEVAAKRVEEYDPASEHRFRRPGQALLSSGRAKEVERTHGFVQRLRAKVEGFRREGGQARLEAFSAKDKKEKARLLGLAKHYERMAKRYEEIATKTSAKLASNQQDVRILNLQALRKRRSELVAARREATKAYEAATADWEKEAKKAKKAKKPAPKKPVDEGLQLDAEIHKLEQRIKGYMGTAQQTRRGVPKVASPGTTKLEEAVQIEGLDPVRNEASYLLSLGRWDNVNEHGLNVFTEKTAKKLYNEFSGVIAGIVHGKAWREGTKKGWLRQIPGAEELAEDFTQDAFELLMGLASRYTPQFAKQKLDQGINFRKYAISYLDNEMRKRLLAYVNKHKSVFANVDADTYEALSREIDPDAPDAADTKEAMRGSLERRNLSGEEVVMMKDVKKVLSRHLSPAETVILLSRFNLHNSVDNPKGGKGLKSWHEVARDMAAYTGRSNKFWLKHGPKVWGLMRKRLRSSAIGMTPEEVSATKEGFKILVSLIAGSKAAPGNEEWYIEGEKGASAKDLRSVPKPKLTGVVRRLKGQSSKDRPLIRKVRAAKEFTQGQTKLVVREDGRRVTPASHVIRHEKLAPTVGTFWQARSSAAKRLGVDVSWAGTSTQRNVNPGTAINRKVRIATAYQAAWSKLSRMDAGKLKEFTKTKEFKDWAKHHKKVSDIQAKVMSGELSPEGVPSELRATRNNLKLKVGRTYLYDVSPNVIRIVVQEIQKEKKGKALKKSMDEVDSELLKLIDQVFRLATA